MEPPRQKKARTGSVEAMDGRSIVDDDTDSSSMFDPLLDDEPIDRIVSTPRLVSSSGDAAMDEIRRLRLENRHRQKSMDEAYAKLDDAYAMVERQHEKILEKERTVAVRVEELETQATEKDRRIKSLEKQIKSLETQVTEKDQRIQSLERQATRSSPRRSPPAPSPTTGAQAEPNTKPNAEPNTKPDTKTMEPGAKAEIAEPGAKTTGAPTTPSTTTTTTTQKRKRRRPLPVGGLFRTGGLTKRRPDPQEERMRENAAALPEIGEASAGVLWTKQVLEPPKVSEAGTEATPSEKRKSPRHRTPKRVPMVGETIKLGIRKIWKIDGPTKLQVAAGSTPGEIFGGNWATVSVADIGYNGKLEVGTTFDCVVTFKANDGGVYLKAINYADEQNAEDIVENAKAKYDEIGYDDFGPEEDLMYYGPYVNDTLFR